MQCQALAAPFLKLTVLLLSMLAAGGSSSGAPRKLHRRSGPVDMQCPTTAEGEDVAAENTACQALPSNCSAVLHVGRQVDHTITSQF